MLKFGFGHATGLNDTDIKFGTPVLSFPNSGSDHSIVIRQNIHSSIIIV